MFQFGFRKYHSTSLALIDVLDDTYGNIVIGIYLDLQKAFYTVDRSILLSKLIITVFVEMFTIGLNIIKCMIDDGLFRSKESNNF